jgi:glutathione S-transferase
MPRLRFTGADMTQAAITVAMFWLFGRARRPRFFAGLGCAARHDPAERLQVTPEFQVTWPEPETLTDQLA